MRNWVAVFAILLLRVTNLSAQQQRQGSVLGSIIEKTTNSPLEFATVIIKSNTDSTFSQGTATGKKGEFIFNNLTYGDYRIIYSFIGFDKVETPVFSLNAKRSKIDLGKLFISESTTVLGDISVVGQRSMILLQIFG
jgi:hypothetical protein